VTPSPSPVGDPEEILRGFPERGVRDAVRALLENLSRDDAADLHERLVHLVVAVRDGRAMEDSPDLSAGDLASLYRLIDVLRSAILERWSEGEPPDSREMLRVLQTLDRVRQGLTRGDERDTLANTLAVVRGPEVLMELAHDIRSPLTSILFLAETLRRGQSGPLTELQQVQIGIIYSAALSLLSMVTDVTELARTGEQLAEQSPSSCALSEILDSVSDLVTPMIDERRVILRVLPPKTDLRIGYPIALRRVLLNLTTNALKFTERGLVEVAAREIDATRIEFSVRDTGQGIHPEMQPTMFEPFRTRPTNGRIGLSGTGLGLWTSRRLVADMGGELQFETKVGWGTRFFFELHMPVAPQV
jgi:signal transduction histidine kinase